MNNPIKDQTYFTDTSDNLFIYQSDLYKKDKLRPRINRYGGVSEAWDGECTLCRAENSPQIACRHTDWDEQTSPTILVPNMYRHPKKNIEDSFFIEDDLISNVHVGFRIVRNK
jgi:hypothetical protein